MIKEHEFRQAIESIISDPDLLVPFTIITPETSQDKWQSGVWKTNYTEAKIWINNTGMPILQMNCVKPEREALELMLFGWKFPDQVPHIRFGVASFDGRYASTSTIRALPKDPFYSQPDMTIYVPERPTTIHELARNPEHLTILQTSLNSTNFQEKLVFRDWGREQASRRGLRKPEQDTIELFREHARMSRLDF